MQHRQVRVPVPPEGLKEYRAALLDFVSHIQRFGCQPEKTALHGGPSPHDARPENIK